MRQQVAWGSDRSQAFTAGLSSVTGRGRGNGCVQVRGYGLIAQFHLCLDLSTNRHACCKGFLLWVFFFFYIYRIIASLTG